MTEVERQAEAAFQYRGNVTITLADGQAFEAYVSNRELRPHPKLGAPFIDVLRAGKPGAPERIRLAQVASIALTGQDHAAFTPPAPADDA